MAALSLTSHLTNKALFHACAPCKSLQCMPSLQPLDRMERDEVRKEAEKFVEPGFKLVAKEKVGLGRVAMVWVPGVKRGM